MPSETIEGTEFFFEDRGSGPPLLLVHGFPLDHSMWSGQREELARQHRVIAPDLRGFGRSGGAGEILTMDQMADDLARLLDAISIDEPVVLCGLSMGGYVAFSFFRRHRQRLARLILCDTRAAADSADAAAGRRQSADRAISEGVDFLVDGMLEKLFAPATRENPPAFVAEAERVMRSTAPATVAAALRGMAERADATELLPAIDVPTLVLGGEHDAITPPDEMRSFAAQIPQAQFVAVPDAGHMAPLEQAAAVNRTLLAFLAQA